MLSGAFPAAKVLPEAGANVGWAACAHAGLATAKNAAENTTSRTIVRNLVFKTLLLLF
jgi:hypothetical protein